MFESLLMRRYLTAIFFFFIVVNGIFYFWKQKQTDDLEKSEYIAAIKEQKSFHEKLSSIFFYSTTSQILNETQKLLSLWRKGFSSSLLGKEEVRTYELQMSDLQQELVLRVEELRSYELLDEKQSERHHLSRLVVDIKLRMLKTSQGLISFFQQQESLEKIEMVRWRVRFFVLVILFLLVLSLFIIRPFALSMEKSIKELSFNKKELEKYNEDLGRKVQVSTRLINREHARFNAILESAKVAIISTDLNGIIQTFNPGAEEILGYRASEVIGQQTPLLFHDKREVEKRAKELSLELGGEVIQGMEVFILRPRAGQPDQNEWTYRAKDGRKVPVLLSVSSIRDEDHKICGFLEVAYDLSERKKLEKMKSEFISTVSHELRTPLTSIKGSLKLLMLGGHKLNEEKKKELLDMANNNSERLLRLINDILDIEKMESQRMDYHFQELEVNLLIDETIQENSGLFHQAMVEVVNETKHLQAKIFADKDRFKQVLTNLISNSSKFTFSGDRIVINASVIHDHFVRISVTDHGPGIPDTFRDRIFERFSQSDSSDSRLQSGTGLGLYLCKKMVEDMGGMIAFDSRPKFKTTFFFDLPMAKEKT